MNNFANGWYAILSQRELRRMNKPLAIQRFGLNLVLWRSTDNEIIALLDRCPHRSAQLSLGKIIEGNITCPFHGFQFDKEGRCQFAPEFAKALPGLSAQKFATHQAFGMIWLYFGKTVENFSFPLLDKIHTGFKGVFSQTKRIWKANITRAIENQLDYTHLPFVHKNTIGRHYQLPDKPRLETTETSLSVYLRDTQEKPSFTFLFPNAWNLSISDKLQLVVYFVPIDQHRTQFYLTSYRSFLNLPLIKKLFDPVFNWANLMILKQDQRVVESQATTPSITSQEVLMRHDAAIKYFRQRWENTLSNS